MAYDVDRKPATWVMTRSLQRERRIWAAAALAIVLGAMPFLVHRLWPVSVVATVALVLILRPYGNRHLRMLRGAVAERDVGETLNQLRREAGWIVMHDIKQPGEGNVDHLVSGPNGVFVVETKHRWYRDAALTTAKRQAAKIGRELGVFVTPVICLYEPRKKVFQHRSVWVVPRRDLLHWLRSQHGKPVEFERLARYADNL